MGSWLGLWSLGLGLGRRWAGLRRFWAGRCRMYSGVIGNCYGRLWAGVVCRARWIVDSTTYGAGILVVYFGVGCLGTSNNDIRRIAKGSKSAFLPFFFSLRNTFIVCTGI